MHTTTEGVVVDKVGHVTPLEHPIHTSTKMGSSVASCFLGSVVLPGGFCTAHAVATIRQRVPCSLVLDSSVTSGLRLPRVEKENSPAVSPLRPLLPRVVKETKEVLGTSSPPFTLPPHGGGEPDETDVVCGNDGQCSSEHGSHCPNRLPIMTS